MNEPTVSSLDEARESIKRAMIVTSQELARSAETLGPGSSVCYRLITALYSLENSYRQMRLATNPDQDQPRSFEGAMTLQS